MLGIIVAVDYEVAELLKQAQKQTIHHQDFYLFNNDVVLTFSGIGKANAARSTANLLNNFDVDCVLNAGTSGSCNKFIKPLDVILVNKCGYGDVDVTIDASYAINQMPREPKYFEANSQAKNLLKSVLQDLNISFILGNVVTVDSFVTQANFHKFNEITHQDNLAIDMEATAIAQTCYHFQKDFGMIKFISDTFHANVCSNNHDEFLVNTQTIAKWMDQFLIKLINDWKNKWTKN